MKPSTLFAFTVILFLQLTGIKCLIAQNRWTIHGGAKLIEYRGSSIQFYYIDESPTPDEFYTNIKLKDKTIYNLGGNVNHYIPGNSFYWDFTANLYFGSYFGGDVGGSLGYPLFLNQFNTVSVLPTVSAGGGFYNMSLGNLENNSIYIEVNNTRFGDYTDVELGISNFYLFLKPSLALVLDLNYNAQIRISGSYLINLDLAPEITFNGTDQSGEDASDQEKLSESNLAFFIDGKKSNDSPFKLSGIEFRIGISFLL